MNLRQRVIVNECGEDRQIQKLKNEKKRKLREEKNVVGGDMNSLGGTKTLCPFGPAFRGN